MLPQSLRTLKGCREKIRERERNKVIKPRERKCGERERNHFSSTQKPLRDFPWQMLLPFGTQFLFSSRREGERERRERERES